MSPTGNSYNNYVDSFFDVYYIKHVLITLSISLNIKRNHDSSEAKGKFSKACIYLCQNKFSSHCESFIRLLTFKKPTLFFLSVVHEHLYNESIDGYLK